MKYLFEYLGQEGDARRLLLTEKLVKPEEIAVMSGGEVSDMIQRYYTVISTHGEEILLVRKEDLDTFNSITKVLHR